MQNIQITDAALSYIEKMLQKTPGVGFRLSIKKTGCSGYSYAPSIVETVPSGDFSLVLKNGITLFIDASWAHLLEGITIDYVEDKTGLKQKRLLFINPKEATRCGCGESFHIE